MKAAIYTVSHGGDGTETANRVNELRDFCRAQSWEIISEYEDRDDDANANRPEFQRMMSVARRRYFDVVLFWALEEFPRKRALSTLQYLNRLSSYGIAYRSFTEPCLDSYGKVRETVVAIVGTIAKQERIRRSDCASTALARAKQRGRKVGRPPVMFARDQVPLLRNAGLSWRQIALRLGVSVGSVRRGCQKPSD